MAKVLVLLAAGATGGAAGMEVLRARRLVRRLRAVALCSHELRGALTTMGFALAGIGRPAGGLRTEALQLGYERALAVARDLETARGTRPEATTMPRPELVDLHELARRVVDAWSGGMPASARPVSLDWQAGRVIVRGYPVRLVQALDNLVANAVEHGRGPVTVTGRSAGPFVSLCVLDRGGGLMRPLDAVGARSWQAPRGHGLVVARHAVEMHGGSLRPVRGPLGAGIEIRLPAGPDQAPVRAAGATNPLRRFGSGAAVP